MFNTVDVVLDIQYDEFPIPLSLRATYITMDKETTSFCSCCPKRTHHSLPRCQHVSVWRMLAWTNHDLLETSSPCERGLDLRCTHALHTWCTRFGEQASRHVRSGLMLCRSYTIAAFLQHAAAARPVPVIDEERLCICSRTKGAREAAVSRKASIQKERQETWLSFVDTRSRGLGAATAGSLSLTRIHGSSSSYFAMTLE